MIKLVLAATWHPRGEMARFQALRPQLEQVCDAIAISLPPDVDPGHVDALAVHPIIAVVVNDDWSWGRHAAVQKALDAGADVIFYADMDRLLRWVETHPDEWRRAVEAARPVDCLIVGRTPRAYRTHPQAMRQTEAISNRICSYLLGREMDFSAGAKAFSRRAAEFLMAYSPPGRALGVDGEWPVLLKRAGFAVDYLEVNGLEWEAADRYQAQAADADVQRQAAALYDRDADNWAWRVQVALEIVQSGLDAARRPLPE